MLHGSVVKRMTAAQTVKSTRCVPGAVRKTSIDPSCTVGYGEIQTVVRMKYVITDSSVSEVTGRLYIGPLPAGPAAR